MADLPNTLRQAQREFNLTPAQRGRYLAALDQLLDRKVREQDPSCDILYPAFQFLGTVDREFGRALSEIYLFSPDTARYRPRQIKYPEIDVFWCWECRDWLPLAQRSYKHNQCNLCHMG